MAVRRFNEQLMLILVAVVFAAIAVIYIKSQGFTNPVGGFKVVQTQNAVKPAGTAAELMKEVNQLEDDGGTGEINSLQKDADSL